jgi:hypothetical protein
MEKLYINNKIKINKIKNVIGKLDNIENIAKIKMTTNKKITSNLHNFHNETMEYYYNIIKNLS